MKTAVVTGLLWAGVMLARLFTGGPVGVADQGGGQKLLCGFGLANSRPWGVDGADYVFTTWESHPWFGETCEPYRSTQLAMIWLEKSINRLLWLPGDVDTRGLGVICAILVGVIVALLAGLLPGRWWIRAAVASTIGLVYADAAFAGFFVSPHTEPVALLGAGFLLAALLWLGRGVTVLRLSLVTAVALVTIGAQVQTVALVVPVCLALLWRPVRGQRWRRGAWWTALRRTPGIVLSLAVIAMASFHLASQPERQMAAARQALVFGSILYDNPGAAKDLQGLGFDPQAALAISELSDGDGTVISLPPALNAVFNATVTNTAIARFYLSHPAHVIRALGWGLEGIGRLSADHLGSYPPEAGHHPGAREHRIAVYSWLWGTFRAAPALLVILWIVTFAAGRSVTRRRGLRPRRKAVGTVAMLVPVMIVAQFAAVLVSAGRVESTHHLTVVSFLTATCIPLLCLSLWVRLQGVRPRPHWQKAPGMPENRRPLASAGV
ncbi:hypothetical protein Aph01nite_15800 [Acrocarpospora phusangensis]|uniref:Uncharacterized protein n=1 Tax=Acrocarpospora phusangensis TaxID=1070424 RepID=A0A919UP40_9ACTN|nr:hypothetical protein [Acrocarpospora phusangensis]GIH23270.1 hypothetical protein Aph01nite_15800 [Acrocarpospora phusangensis]